MRREGVAQRVAGRTLRYTARTYGFGYRALNRRVVYMMTPAFAGLALHVHSRRRKYVLPAPVPIGTRHFTLESPWQWCSHNARAQISLELLLHTLYLNPERSRGEPGKRNASILVALPDANHDLTAIKIDVLHPKLDTLGQTEAAAVHEARA